MAKKKKPEQKATYNAYKGEWEYVEVDVKASSRAPEHKEHRRKRKDIDSGPGQRTARDIHEDEHLAKPFAQAASGVKPKTAASSRGEDMNWDPSTGVSYADWAKNRNASEQNQKGLAQSIVGKGQRDKRGGPEEADIGSGWKGGSGAPPGSRGPSWDQPFDTGNSEEVRRRIAVRAAELYSQTPFRKLDESDRRGLSVNYAIMEFQKNHTNLNMQQASPGEINQTAFGFNAKQMSEGELTQERGPSETANRTKKAAQKVQDTSRTTRKASGRLTKIEAAKKEGGKEKVAKMVKETQAKKSTLQPGQKVTKSKISNQEFLRAMSPDEGAWVDKQLNEPGGLFYGAKGNRVPGRYRKWQQYVNARQEKDAYGKPKYKAPTFDEKGSEVDPAGFRNWLQSDMRGRNSTTDTNRTYKEQSDEAIKAQYTKGIVKPGGVKQRDRYSSLAPSHEDLGVGIRMPGVRGLQQLKEENPDASERQLIELQQSDIQSVEELAENQRVAHETRQATILGRDRSETSAGPKDRVVFFTTSTGWPATSVSADSLIGQYIIKKRKKMLYDQRMAPRAELKGEFPYAVRDQHLVEVATGLSVGAQGRYGAFRQVGYRVGTKKSKGYGKMLPVGSQILRDSSGQPIYDRNGNVRYSTGFTRPFDIRPSNEVGMRIYLG